MTRRVVAEHIVQPVGYSDMDHKDISAQIGVMEYVDEGGERGAQLTVDTLDDNGDPWDTVAELDVDRVTALALIHALAPVAGVSIA